MNSYLFGKGKLKTISFRGKNICRNVETGSKKRSKLSSIWNLILKCVILLAIFAFQMIIISKTKLRDFGAEYPQAIDALNDWYCLVKEADWGAPGDVRKMFNSVDYVGNDRFVFNIRGNRYRVVVMIFFDIRTVFIRFAGTHAEYAKMDVTTI
jgi:mRNA interferase HigB